MDLDGVPNGLEKDLSNLHLEVGGESQALEGQKSFEMSEPPKPQPRLRNTRDITKEFLEAASTLKTGQLIKDESFTLFESVSALEIMDPKMDSGFLEPGELLEDDYDILRQLLPEEVVGIMDQMLCLEVAWHMGHPLSQTLFTSLYIDKLLWPDPETLAEARFDRGQPDGNENMMLHSILRAYCLATIKCCDFVLRTVGSESYYEEEDFVTNTYNRKLLVDFETGSIMNLLREARACLAKDYESIDQDVFRALSFRLAFRMSFLSAVDPSTGEGSNAWRQCSFGLSGIEGTKCGKPVPEAFSVKIQRKLASTVPPRPMVTVKFDEAFSCLKQLCQDAIDAEKVLDYNGTVNLSDLLRVSLQTIVDVLQSRKPQPLVYARSIIQSFLFQESDPTQPSTALGAIPVGDFFLDDLAEVVLPADILLSPENAGVEVPTDPRHKIAKVMDEFVIKAYPYLLDYFRACCMNRSRMRRMLCNMLPDWDNLQIFAEDTHHNLHPYVGSMPELALPLCSWAFYHKLRMMQQIILLGCELCIYQSRELPAVYWYLSAISRILLDHLFRIREFSALHESQHNQFLQQKHVGFIEFARAHATAIGELATSLHLLYTLLGRVPPSKSNMFSTSPDKTTEGSYADPELQYPHRFHPFDVIMSPPFPSYKAFTESVNMPQVSTASLLSRAEEAVGRAKKGVDRLVELKPTEMRYIGVEAEWTERVKKEAKRVAIMVGVGVGLVKESLKNKREISVEVPESDGEGGWLGAWIIPKIKVSRK
ncbi:MAG: hypothetical protein M1834_008067 [Cirrosporium novae-zelandiae]|nr:MAG: hypothetical protein M1834_008067 [Cirrosporium novae-zelandiae]